MCWFVDAELQIHTSQFSILGYCTDVDVVVRWLSVGGRKSPVYEKLLGAHEGIRCVIVGSSGQDRHTAIEVECIQLTASTVHISPHKN